MRYSRSDKAIIRSIWPYLRLRFRADGTVEAQKHLGGAWGVLFHDEQSARREIDYIKEQDARRRTKTNVRSRRNPHIGSREYKRGQGVIAALKSEIADMERKIQRLENQRDRIEDEIAALKRYESSYDLKEQLLGVEQDIRDYQKAIVDLSEEVEDIRREFRE